MQYSPATIAECQCLMNETHRIWSRYAQPKRHYYRVTPRSMTAPALALAVVLTLASVVSAILSQPASTSSAPAHSVLATNPVVPVLAWETARQSTR